MRKNSNTAATNMTSDVVVSEHDKSFQSPGESNITMLGDLADQAPSGLKHNLMDRREFKKSKKNKTPPAKGR